MPIPVEYCAETVAAATRFAICVLYVVADVVAGVSIHIADAAELSSNAVAVYATPVAKYVRIVEPRNKASVTPFPAFPADFHTPFCKYKLEQILQQHQIQQQHLLTAI